MTDSLSGVWYGLSEESIQVSIEGTDADGNEVDWINELGDIIPIKDRAMIWFMSTALNGGELRSRSAYSFRMIEDSADRETLWVDFCQNPVAGESTAIKLMGNLISISGMSGVGQDGFENIMALPGMFMLPDDTSESMIEKEPIPIEINNNSRILFDTVTRTHTISRPLSDLEDHISSNNEEAIARPPANRPVASDPLDTATDPSESITIPAELSRVITPDMMLNITFTQTVDRQWIKIKNSSSDLLGVARYADQGFDVGCFYLMQANTSGNLSGVVDMDAFEYGVASVDQQREWSLSESNRSFFLPGISDSNRYASFETQDYSNSSFTSEQVASLESQQNELHEELQTVSSEYFKNCSDQQFDYPQKPVYDPDTGGPARPPVPPMPLPSQDSNSSNEETSTALSESECLDLRLSIDDLQERIFAGQMILDKILYGDRDYFSTEWGTLSFEKFAVDGNLHEIKFETFLPQFIDDSGAAVPTEISDESGASNTGEIILRLSP
ncbi:MAG: hypothetical protein P8104_01040 [Gammaproteobacteria bacterium]